MKFVFLIFTLSAIGFLGFQSAFAFTPIVTVTDSDNHVITQGWTTLFNIRCDVYGGYVRINVEDNGNQIATLDTKTTPISSSFASSHADYQYIANGAVGTHNINFSCVDDSGEEGFFNYILNEYPVGQTQSSYYAAAQTQDETISQTQDSFHFDNGLFTLVFIGMVILTFILILALSHGGHFRRRERLEPTRQATNIFDMYRDNVNRTIDTRGSLPLGYDETQIDIALPPPTKILDSVWNDADAKKEIVKRIAKDPVAMMEVRRIEMTENLGRVCPRCTDPIRNDRGEITHCVFCCKFFQTSEQLDLHKCKNSKEAGI